MRLSNRIPMTKDKNGLTVLDRYAIKTGKSQAKLNAYISDVNKWEALVKAGQSDQALDNRVGGLKASIKAVAKIVAIDKATMALGKIITTLPMAEGTYQQIEQSAENLLNTVVTARKTGVKFVSKVSMSDPYDDVEPLREVA